MMGKRGITFRMPSVIVLLLVSMVLGMSLARAQDDPETHLPVRVIRFQNVGNDALVDTAVTANTYYCVATGWSGRWDIQENHTGNNYVWTQVRPTLAGNRWFLRTSFRSHNDNENLDVDVVCFRNDLAAFEGRNGATTTLFDPD